ncbi:T9SS type A sorting domain-containing protein, partial [Gilvibacter sp.]|uniref:T9SS type A sorting domain-containing protein n=1 Tax=Gilvibacter sp. TaxID=2729997 RepID=UPI0025C6CAD1
PVDGMVYYFSEGTGGRSIFTLDVGSGTSSEIAAITSSGGANNANAMAFDRNGVLYVAFGSGDLNIVDPSTGVGTALGTLPGSGGAGMTYDWDNDRLIYTVGTGPIDVYEIDTTTGVSNLLFQFASVPGAGGSCTSQAVEYVGNGKCISSSTFGCGIIYTIDLNTEAVVSLSDPNPFDNSIKDLMYINAGSPFAVACNDATTEVQADLSVPLEGWEISNAPIDNLWAVDAFAGGSMDVHLYTYDADTDDISVRVANQGMSGSNQFYGIDWHPIENTVYIMQDNDSFERSLFRVDDITVGAITFIDTMVSPLGDTQPQDFTFGSDGAIYVTFQSGEIGLYDISTGTMNAFADVGAAGSDGGVGLTYDFDNSRLLHASGSSTVNVNAIDLATGTVSALVSFPTPDGGCGGTAQGLEYIGGDRALGSTTFGCDSIYVVDLTSGTGTQLTSPSSDGLSSSIKDLMYVSFEHTLSPDPLDCDDVGDVTVNIMVTDLNGNMSSCDATVTVEDPNDFCALSVDEFTEAQVVLYPNPAGDQLQIQWNANEALESIQIFDITGKQVLTQTMNQNAGLTLDVSELATGLYVVKLQSAAGTAVKRLIKQ